MLIVDSANAPRLVAGNKRESHTDQIRTWVAEQTANAVYLKDNDLSPANADRQIGQKMFASELELRLKKLSPNLLFEVNPFNATKKALYHVRRGEGKVFICAYENGVMPEHSIMKVKEELVRDLSVGVPGAPLNRKDLPKHEFVPGNGFVFDDTVAPLGFKKVLIPWGEYIRGWRTVTIRLVEQKIVTPTQVENIFGADNRPEWARHMGHKDIQLPW